MRKKLSLRDTENIPDDYSYCVTCKKKKHNYDFHWYLSPDGKARTRVNGSCKNCRSALSKETESLKKIIIPLCPRPKWGELCESCHKPVYERQGDIPEGVEGTYAFSFDHEHGSTHFRGWICKPCNTGFGLLGDTYESVKERLEYLKRAKLNENKSQRSIPNLMEFM